MGGIPIPKHTMYLYGKNSVLERLKVNPRSIRRIFLEHNFSVPEILNKIKSRKIPVKRVGAKEILRIKRADRLQGIVAEIDKFRYIPFDELIGAAAGQKLSLILLDSLNDPHNLGSIIRICACFGRFAVVIPEHRCCEVNDTVIHVASGGENFVPVAKVHNIAQALVKAKRSGYWAAGAVVEGGEDLIRVSLPFPLCLVLGSEGGGIRPGIAKHFDLKLSLPMRGQALSLNVAMAAAIFCHQIAGRRDNNHPDNGQKRRS